MVFNRIKNHESFTISASRLGRETVLTFNLDEKGHTTGIAKLFSATGGFIREMAVNGGETRLKLAGVHPGLYYCLVFLGHRVHSNTFVVPAMNEYSPEVLRFSETR